MFKKRAARILKEFFPVLLLLSGILFFVICYFCRSGLLLSAAVLMSVSGTVLLFCLLYKKSRYIVSIKETLSEYDPSVDTRNPEAIKEVIEQYSGKIYEMELLKNKAESAHLQSQINPHFLYNTLDTIRGHAVLDGSYEVANMIEILARLFRYSISEKNEMLTIEDELNNIQDYLVIQKYRFGDRFNVNFDIDTSDVKVLFYMIPKLTLQPLIENAIKHGLEGMTGGGLITIRIFTTQNRIYICVEDNGQSVDPEKIRELNQKLDSNTETQLHEDHGIALLNIQKRIKHYYGKEYGLHLLLGAENGICAEIELPWTNEP